MAGRPPKPEAERKAVDLRIRMTEAERDMVSEAAQKAYEGRTMPGSGVTSTWARDLLLREAGKLLKK